MGTNYDNESKYLYKIDENLNTTQLKYYSCFEKTPEKEGAFRFCYFGTIKDQYDDPSSNSYFPDDKCVVKVFKKKVAQISKIVFMHAKFQKYLINYMEMYFLS